MNKQRIMIITLSIALFLMAQYIIYEKITESRQQELIDAYKNGYNKGLTDAAVTVYKQTENCRTASITIGNITKNVFDLSCLKIQSKNGT